MFVNVSEGPISIVLSVLYLERSRSCVSILGKVRQWRSCELLVVKLTILRDNKIDACHRISQQVV